MDQIILGLLMMCNRTIYQLRERVNEGINLMYSSSMGSIQAAIQKLLGGGYIAYEEVTERGRHKKVYRITESGRRHFLEWVNGPMEGQGPKSPELAKVYFMGFAERENREAGIRQHVALLKEKYRVLEAICEDAKRVEVCEEHRDILNYQLVSALYGKDWMRFNIEWFENLLEKMRNGEI